MCKLIRSFKVYKILMLLKRSQCRMPLTVIVVGSAFAFLCVVAAIVYAAVQGYIGFGMTDSSALSCSNYLALKTEWNRSLLYSTAFVGYSAAALFLASAASLSALLCWANRSETREEFPEFTFAKLCALYLLLSLAAMGLVPGVGFHLTFMVEKGANCTGKYSVNWIIFVVLLGTALLMTLVAWIFLFILRTLIKDQQKNEVQQSPISMAKQQNSPFLEKQPQNMKNYLSSIMIESKLINKTQREQIKQPLLSQIGQEDKVQQDQDAVKIVFQQFQLYKKRQQLIKRKEEQQQNIVQQYLREKQRLQNQVRRQKQQERIKSQERKNLKYMVLSPDDPNFDAKILEQSSQDHPIEVPLTPSNNQKQHTYPANYTPKDEQDEKKYNQFKRNLLKQLGFQKHQMINRHPQNMQGGRSKRMIDKYIKQGKRPKRNQQMYLKAIQQQLKMNVLPKQPTIFKETIVQNIQESSKDEEENKQFKQYAKQLGKQQKKESPVILNLQLSEQSQKIEKPERIFFQKEKKKSPLKKQLFDEGKSFLNSHNNSSILGYLINGVIESEPKSRLKQIKESRNQQRKTPTRKRGSIIDEIRYKYQ